MNNIILKVLIESIGIGIILGMPIGTMGMLAFLITLKQGFRKGIAVGLSAALSDLCYASVSVFGLSFIRGFLLSNKKSITLIGSIVIIAMGAFIFLQNDSVNKNVNTIENKSTILYFVSSLPIAFSNPVAIVTFGVTFSTIGIELGTLPLRLVCCLGTFLGAFSWWLLLSGLVSRYSNRISLDVANKLRRIGGIILIMFGIGMLFVTFVPMVKFRISS